jgi:hypothetical protein
MKIQKALRNQLPKKETRGTMVLGEVYHDFAMFQMKNYQFAIIRGDEQLLGYFMGELNYATKEGDVDNEGF